MINSKFISYLNIIEVYILKNFGHLFIALNKKTFKKLRNRININFKIKTT